MAKTKAPLFSESAHGSIGSALTYSARALVKQVRYQRRQHVHSSEYLYVSRDKFFAGQMLYAILTLPERIFWALVAKVGWAPLDVDHIQVPVADGRRGAGVFRNQYLPELLIGKGVPRTEQSTIYYTGDDGTYKAGYSPHVPRFQANNDGTVTDLATGLMWVADPSEIGGVWGTPGNPETMSWYDAVTNCNNLSYAGYSDWRLPNAKELESLIDYSKSSPAIDSQKFPNAKNGGYWSGSGTNYGCENEWFNMGNTGQKSWEQDKNLKKNVRPVREAPKGHRMHQPRKAK